MIVLKRFFYAASLAVGQHCDLPPVLLHRVLDVLRMKSGDRMVLFNGRGGEYICVLNTALKQVQVSEFIATDRSAKRQLTLVLAASFGKKMDWIMQKATELGVSEIQPIITDRSKLNRPPTESMQRRWSKIIESACEQCGLNRLPVLKPGLPFDVWLEQCGSQPIYYLDPHHATSAPSVPSNRLDLAVLIGCEGGWSARETAMLAERDDVHPCYLGERILRMETAVVIACGWFNCLNA